jgi:hypothetical protein
MSSDDTLFLALVDLPPKTRLGVELIKLLGQDMNTRLTKYTRCTAAILAFAALASSRDFWWQIDNTDSLGLYSTHLIELLAGGIGLVCLLAGALLLAMPNRKGFWAIYLSAIVTFGGFLFPGRAPLSYIPFLSFGKEPYRYLLPMAGNILTILALICLHVLTHIENTKRSPNKPFQDSDVPPHPER